MFRSSHQTQWVEFDANAGGDIVENMPRTITVSQDEAGNLPNEVPRREGFFFTAWNTEADGGGVSYYPGAMISMAKSDQKLYAQWTQDPSKVNFRTIAYMAGGTDVVLADNPQIYTADPAGVRLINPWRKDYIFTGWTCEEIDLVDPQVQVTVRWNGQADASTDFVNRTYMATWLHQKYNVIWRNWDGSLLGVTRNVYDVLPSYEGSTPVRPSDDSHFYAFNGWTPAILPVTQDTEYTAVYTQYPLLKIVSSPADQSVPKDERITFAVEAAGGEQPVTYQWYVIPAGQSGEPSAGAGSPISGATGDTLAFVADERMSGNRYYCVVRDSVGQQICTDAALLSVTQELNIPNTGDRFPLLPLLLLCVSSGLLLLYDRARRTPDRP